MIDQGYIPGVGIRQSSDPNGYWTLWKLPLFNAGTVRRAERVKSCRSEYSSNFIRVVGFDNETGASSQLHRSQSKFRELQKW